MQEIQKQTQTPVGIYYRVIPQISRANSTEILYWIYLCVGDLHSEDQPWDFFGRNDAKAETTVLWPPHEKSWLTGKDWCWEGLGAGGEGDDRGWDGWMASLTRRTSEWTPGVGDGQGGLVCCDSWGRKESDTTEWLNWTELNSSKNGHKPQAV